jgi:hypothetical protein
MPMVTKRTKSQTFTQSAVMVIAVAGFRHRGQYIRTGETAYMGQAEADDMAALNMVRILKPATEAPAEATP